MFWGTEYEVLRNPDQEEPCVLVRKKGTQKPKTIRVYPKTEENRIDLILQLEDIDIIKSIIGLSEEKWIKNNVMIFERTSEIFVMNVCKIISLQQLGGY